MMGHLATILISSCTAAVVNTMVWFFIRRSIERMDGQIMAQGTALAELEELRIKRIEAAIEVSGGESRDGRRRVYQHMDQHFVKAENCQALRMNSDQRIRNLEECHKEFRGDLSFIRTQAAENNAVIKLIAQRLNISLEARK